MKRMRYFIWLLAGIGLISCTPRSVREAQTVVSQADSLWHEGRMYGIDAGDSATLAQAYSTLKTYSVFCSFVPCTSSLGTYVHACYHYGKLLRAQDDPVSAMQVFIRATHSNSHDYPILGRIYSNMGDVCHIAADYPLSYDMYERSGEMYLRSGDSLLYYYDLNNMAYELAHLRKKTAALQLLELVEQECTDYNVLTKILETKAETYLSAEQYDSAIYYATELYQRGNHEPNGILIRAQAYSFLGIADSAVYYSRCVLAISNSLFHRNNALYILTNEDQSMDTEAVRRIAAERADTQKLIEIRQSKLSQAVQLLEQDLNREPDLRWVYAIMMTALLTGGAFYWRYRIRKRQMRSQVEQMIERQNDNIMQSIKQHIDVNDLTHTLHWKNYAAMKADADLYMGSIVSKLEKLNLNETEIRFCLLAMLDFSLSHTAETIHYSYPSGIKTLKKRISVKLGTTPPQLHDFLFQLASKAQF